MNITGSKRASTRLGGRLLAALLLSLSILTIAGVEATQPSRGVGLSDEGLYLQALANSQREEGWGFPWHWNLSWLWDLTGHDIATFRTTGVVIIVALAGATSVITTLRLWKTTSDTHTSGPWVAWSVIASSISASISVLAYYFPFLRTPSYNWLSLVALLLGALAAMSLIFSPRRQTNPWLTALAPSILGGLGLFVALPAKPSVGLFLVASSAFLLLSRSHRPVVVRVLLLSIVFASSLVLISSQIHLWPGSLFDAYANRFRSPRSEAEQGVLQALYEVTQIPASAFHALGWQLIALAAIALIFGTALILRYRGQRLVAATLPLLYVGVQIWFLMANGLTPFGPRGPNHLSDWVDQRLGATSVALTLIYLSWGYARFFKESRNNRLSAALILGILCWLAFLPFVGAFGSSNDLVGLSARFSFFFWLVWLGVTWVLFNGRARVISLTSLLITSCILVTNGLAQGAENPYGLLDSMHAQNRVISIGSEASALKVDETTADLLTDIANTEVMSAAEGGAVLLPLSSGYGSLYVYALGFESVPSLIISVPNSSNWQSVATHHIDLLRPTLEGVEPWILLDTDSKQALNDSSGGSLSSLYFEMLGNGTAPEGYCLVSRNREVAIWAPTAARPSCSS